MAALAAALLAGCGDAGDEGSQGDAPAAVQLRVTVQDDGRSAGTLRCGPPGTTAAATGALDDRSSPEALCAHAREMAELLATAPDGDRVCTAIFGGPQTARVQGTLDGERVDRPFDRTDGCAIADWDAAVPLLPRVRGAAAPAPAP